MSNEDDDLDQYRPIKRNGIGAMYRSKSGEIVTITALSETGYYLADNGDVYNGMGCSCSNTDNDLGELVGFNQEATG